MSEKNALGEDLGRLLLRGTVAGLMLFHGSAKLMHGVSGISAMLVRRGLPASLSVGVFVGEVIAPVAIVVGIFTRPAALVLAFNMLVATWLVHAGDVLRLSTTGGWRVELQMLYLGAALSIALMGPGRFALSRGQGAWWR
ncbi:MAG: DoxX family protein [Deltaproteobacteria bacterium]|nr:DoxX family protein [Deltaproteobacteria bacterium]